MDGHVLRKDSDDVAKEILFWTLEGKRQRETPRITWRRSAERKELKSVHQTWSEIRKVAQDRSRWTDTVNALCVHGAKSIDDDDKVELPCPCQ